MRVLIGFVLLLAGSIPADAQEEDAAWENYARWRDSTDLIAIKDVDRVAYRWDFVNPSDSLAVDSTSVATAFELIVLRNFSEFSPINWAAVDPMAPDTSAYASVALRLWTVGAKGAMAAYHLRLECETVYPEVEFGNNEILGMAGRDHLDRGIREAVEQMVQECALEFFRSRSRSE